MNDALALIARIEADLASLKRLLDVPAAANDTAPEEWLAPCQIAERLGIGEAYARKLIRRGLVQELPGFDKRGGRLFACADAVAGLWDG